MKQLLTTLFVCLSFFVLRAQEGHEIRVDIQGFELDSLYLAYYYGDKQYIRDTTARTKKGDFVFKGEEPLPGGVYLIVMPPDNRFFEVLVDSDDQDFSLETSSIDPSVDMKIKGSEDNRVFYEYLHFLGEKRPKAEALNEEKKQAGEEDVKRIAEIDRMLEAINAEVRSKQDQIINKHPDYLATAIIKANRNMEFPEFEGTEEEINLQKWRYSVEHYFDNIDLKDDRLVRTPFLFQRLDYFVNKLTVQHPDSLSQAISRILDNMNPEGENFKYYLIHFLNTYAKSKIVGMDAVYVHLVEKYYKTGMAPWTEEEQLQKIIENADKLKPLLIGKIAPDITMQRQDGRTIRLHEVESPYTVLFFWDPDCGHCKKSAPKMVEFHNQFKDRGVKIFSVCSKFTDEVPECWKSIDEHDYSDFINVVDPYHRSKYKSIYDIRSTPQIYILDEKKEILSKRIGAEQLGDVMERIMEMNGD